MHVAVPIQEEEWPGVETPRPVRRNPAIDDHDARRCAICGGKFPSFGYAPPAIAKGEIWACNTHRNEIEARLSTPSSEQSVPDQQLPLL